jgi:hypothetical protein
MNNVFKYQKTESGDCIIFTGPEACEQRLYLCTDRQTFVLFENEYEAQIYCKKLNRITNKANHFWK